jgi:alpha/beta superfamily hydrolase
MAEVFHRNFFLEGPAGRLEAMLWTVADAKPERVAVLCHPHPLFGGTMHNKVIFHAAKTLQRRGIPVLRFNFRGAGLSEGEHDKGRGELGDVRAALAFLVAKFPRKPILLGGFSFGSWVGLRVGCEDPRVTELVGMGIPAGDSDFSYLRSCTKPKLILQGSRDRFGPRESVEALVAELPEPKRVVFIERADHFFTGKLHEMTAALDDWLEGLNGR